MLATYEYSTIDYKNKVFADVMVWLGFTSRNLKAHHIPSHTFRETFLAEVMCIPFARLQIHLSSTAAVFANIIDGKLKEWIQLT